MLNLQPIDALSALRTVLQAPEDERLDRFREGVMAPLRPFWEPFKGFGPPGQPEPDDPMMSAAHRYGYYTPELGAARGLSALEQLERAGSWDACISAIEQGWQRLDPAAHGITIDPLRFTFVLGDPERFKEQDGYSGFGGFPGLVLVIGWPSDYNLPRLPAATAHELNHNVRFSFEPFAPILGQYMVAEGLAEAFAAELCGEEMLGRWAKALTEAQLHEVKPRFREALTLADFNEVRGYIFGDWGAGQFGYTSQGIPDFAGYTVGYRVVRAYLDATGKSAAEATYLPWQEIVEESGFF